MGGDPLKHPFQTIINVFIAIVGVVIILNILGAAIQPYLPWIGMTVTAVLIVLLVGGSVVGVVTMIRYLRNRGGGGHFNG